MKAEKISIEVMDNGFVLEWRIAYREDKLHEYFQTSPAVYKPKTSGKEIITTQKELIKRIKELT